MSDSVNGNGNHRPPAKEAKCGQCRFQIEGDCRHGPPGIFVLPRPVQTQSGIAIPGQGPKGGGPSVQVKPAVYSTYPPAPDQMGACFQFEPRCQAE